MTRRTIRHDPTRWQIEDNEAGEEALRALEAFGLVVLEAYLHAVSRLGHDDGTALALRGLGSLAGRVGMSRLTWQTGVDELGNVRHDAPAAGHAVGSATRRVLNWLFRWPNGFGSPPVPAPPGPPPAAVVLDLDELHALATFVDRRLQSEGLTGPGRRRIITRTTSRRT